MFIISLLFIYAQLSTDVNNTIMDSRSKRSLRPHIDLGCVCLFVCLAFTTYISEGVVQILMKLGRCADDMPLILC